MNSAKAVAESYFIRISDGHWGAIKRPSVHSDFGESVDRSLRNMVEMANKNGDCIINVGNGYYRPIPGNQIDEMELREYLAKDHARVRSIEDKIVCMCESFENKRKDIEYAKQQRERKTGRA